MADKVLLTERYGEKIEYDPSTSSITHSSKDGEGSRVSVRGFRNFPENGIATISTEIEHGGAGTYDDFEIDGKVENIIFHNTETGESTEYPAEEYFEARNNFELSSLDQAVIILQDGVKEDEREALVEIADHYRIDAWEVAREPQDSYAGQHLKVDGDDPARSYIKYSEATKADFYIPTEQSAALVDGVRNNLSANDISVLLRDALEARIPLNEDMKAAANDLHNKVNGSENLAPDGGEPSVLDPTDKTANPNPDHIPEEGKGIGGQFITGKIY